MQVLTDEEYIILEPCESCSEIRVEDIWHEWYCNKKKCIHEKEYNEVKSAH